MRTESRISTLGRNLTLNVQCRQVIGRLQKEIDKMKNTSSEGVVKAANLIREETEKTSPTTPVDYGNLRASWFVVSWKGVAPDPMGYSGHFKKNVKKNIPVSTFKTWHTEAINEARVIVGTNIKHAMVMFGYSANYALWVHEMMDVNFTTREPLAGPKWFQNAVYNNSDKILRTIKENVRIKI